jgi:Na+-translocating ferredoxin:NAD+ oxidoreductase subunit C
MAEAIINAKMVKKNQNLRKAQKQEKKVNGRGCWKPLKNYLGKVVSLSSSELIGKESGISNIITNISRENLLASLESTNITGMSGNGFPVYKKIISFLSSKSTEKILLINAVECDPALLHDEWLLKNRYNEISNTINYLTQVLGLDKVVLATKNKFIKSNDKFSIKIVPPRYPMGEEHFLIRQVLGIPLENNEIPAEHGILVLNIQSIYQIGKIVNYCYDSGRFITIADLTKASAMIAYVYPNDNILELLKNAFGKTDNSYFYHGHGVMECTEVKETDVFSDHENFAAYAEQLGLDDKNKCKHCGSCTRKCPVKIKVSKIVQSIDKNKIIDFNVFNPKLCIKCGSCTYFCPVYKNISGYIRKLNN